MRKIKIFAFIGMLTIAYLVGGIMGFDLCASTQTANANVNTIMDTQGDQINTQTIYVNGQQFIVFTSSRSSMFVVRK